MNTFANKNANRGLDTKKANTSPQDEHKENGKKEIAVVPQKKLVTKDIGDAGGDIGFLGGW